MTITERIGSGWQRAHGLPGTFDSTIETFVLPTESGLLLGWTPYAFGQLRIKMMRPALRDGDLPDILREL